LTCQPAKEKRKLAPNFPIGVRKKVLERESPTQQTIDPKTTNQKMLRASLSLLLIGFAAANLVILNDQTFEHDTQASTGLFAFFPVLPALDGI
jgi:hypothetical protein